MRFSLFFTVLFAVMSIQSASAEDRSRIPDKLPTPIPTLAIIKHYRFTEGEEIHPAPTPTFPIDMKAFSADFKQKMAESVKKLPDIEQTLKNLMVEPTIGKCLLDTTDEIAMGEKFPEGIEGEHSPVYDMLFLEAKDVPEDYKMIFGQMTLIFPLIREEPNIGWSFMEDLSIPCLPYRIRFQGSKIFKDQGLPALKNYSKSPKGQYHDYIKSKYNIQ